MTMTAPDPRQHKVQPAPPPSAQMGGPHSRGQAHATAAQGTGKRNTVTSGAGRRKADSASTPARLQIARTLTAAACLLPGLVGMAQIAGAATAPVSSPTQTYADLRAGVATYEALATAATTRGGGSTEPAALALSRVTAQFGAASLLFPSRASELHHAADLLAKRQAQIETALSKRENASTATVPAPSEELVKGLAALDDPPRGSSSSGSGQIVGAGLIGLSALLAASVWLARTTKRTLNPGLALGAVVTIGVTTLGSQIMDSSQPNSTVDDIASLRAVAARSVADEASALYVEAPSDVASKTRNRLSEANMPPSVGGNVRSEWDTFRKKQLTAEQLTTGSIQNRQLQIADRIGQLDQLTSKMANDARVSGAGADPRPSAWAGYSLFALSLVAGAATWAGVGRRLAEYR